MSASTSLPRTRSSLTTLLAGATLLASLAVPLAVETVAAAPKCFGKPATIVGTAGADKIKGTPKADVIVARGGADVIDGRGGNDRICAGGGDDVVRAGAGADLVSGGAGGDKLMGHKGPDKLFGMAGEDSVLGGDGDDRLVGGADTDRCVQGAGSGASKDCETADLTVVVEGPRNSHDGDVTFSVVVTNLGPDAVSYSLALAQGSQKATCAAPDWVGEHTAAVLAVGASSAPLQVTTSCVKDANGAKVTVDALVSSLAPDPDSLNNAVTGKANLK